jgi:hypothetical protein
MESSTASRRHDGPNRRRNVRLAVIIAMVALLFYAVLWLKALL